VANSETEYDSKSVNLPLRVTRAAVQKGEGVGEVTVEDRLRRPGRCLGASQRRREPMSVHLHEDEMRGGDDNFPRSPPLGQDADTAGRRRHGADRTVLAQHLDNSRVDVLVPSGHRGLCRGHDGDRAAGSQRQGYSDRVTAAGLQQQLAAAGARQESRMCRGCRSRRKHPPRGGGSTQQMTLHRMEVRRPCGTPSASSRPVGRPC
jgi:hypothetical protein